MTSLTSLRKAVEQANAAYDALTDAYPGAEEKAQEKRNAYAVLLDLEDALSEAENPGVLLANALAILTRKGHRRENALRLVQRAAVALAVTED